MAKNSPEEILRAYEWLDSVSTTLNLNPALIRGVSTELLELTRDVAHGRSRPAAPLTTFLVGVASGLALADTSLADGAEQGNVDKQEVLSRIRQVSELLA